MAFISLQNMYDSWKRVSDWVSGANTDKPTVQLATGTNKVGKVQLESSSGVEPGLGSLTADGTGVGNGLTVLGAQYSFNGTNFDRNRNNTQGTLLASASRTTSTGSSYQTNYNARGVYISLDITVAGGVNGVSFTVIGNDPVSGKSFSIAPYTPPRTSVGTYVMEIYPGSSGVAHGTTTGIISRTAAALPRNWSIFVIHNDATPITYSVGYSLIV